MNPTVKSTRTIIFSALSFLCLAAPALAQTNLWTGGGSSSNWSDAGNWTNGVPVSGETLRFGGNAGQNNNNDISGLNNLNTITFLTAGWNVAGNAVGLTNGFTDSGSGGTNIWGLDFSLGNTATISDASDDLIFSGQISGSGGITKSGNGALILTGANTYTGTTTISAGKLQLGNGGATGSVGSGPINLVGGGAVVNGTNNVGLAVNQTGSTLITNALAFSSGKQSVYVYAGQTAVFTGPFSGAGQLWVTGPGMMVISNTGSSYTWTDGIVLNNSALGGLQFDSVSELNGFQIFFGHAGGTLNYVGPSADASELFNNGDIYQGATNVFNISNPTTTLSINDPMGGSGINIKSGPGTLALGAANTYTASTVISNGTLALVGSGAIATSPSIDIVTNATLDVSGESSFAFGGSQSLSGSGSINGNASATTGSINPGGAQSFGTLTFSNNLTINNTPFSFGLSANASEANDQVQVLGNLENDGTTLISLTYEYGSLNPGTYTLITYGSLSGGGSFALGGTYTNTTLNVGANAVTLTVGAGGTVGQANLTWVGDGTANNWDLTTTDWLLFGTLNAFSQGDNVTFNNSGSSTPAINLATALAPNNVTVNATNTYVFSGSGQLTGNLNLTNSGTGTLVLATANTYSGNTTISAGRIQLGNGGPIGNAGGSTINLVGGGAVVNGTNNVGLAVNETGTPVFTNPIAFTSGRQSVYIYAGKTAIFTGPFSGAGQLWLTGPGTMIISNTGSSYTWTDGAVLNSSALGTLQFDSVSVFNNLQVFFGHAGGTLAYTGPTDDGSSLFNSTDIFQGATNVLNIVNPTTTLSVNDPMGGTGTVVKSGPGTLALGAVNVYTASTVVSNGTLALVGSGSINTSAAITIYSNATFDVSGEGSFSLLASQSLMGSGSVNGSLSAAGGAISPGVNSSFGTLTFSNNLTIDSTPFTFGLSSNPSGVNDRVQVLGNLENDGATLITLNYGYLSPGTYTLLTYGSLTGSGTFALAAANTNLTLNVGATSVTLTVGSGGVGSDVNLTWKGDGSANNWDFTTPDWLNSGTAAAYPQGANVTFNDSGSNTPAINLTTILTPNSVTVASSNTYVFSGSGRLSGGLNLAKSGAGTLVLATANDYSGNTTISAGTVQLGNGGSTGSAGSGTITLAGGGAGGNGVGVGLAINETGSPVFSNALSLAVVNQAIYVNAGQTAVFTGPISGGGQLWANGPGTLVISNTGNSYSEQAGVVLANSDLGALQFDNVSEFNGHLIYFAGAGGTLIYAGPTVDGSTMAGASFFQGGTNVVNIANQGTTLTFSGDLTGTGTFVKSGPGALILSGANTYTASTVVSNGLLLINGSLSSSSAASIYANGILGGSGVAATVTVEPGGIVRGGDANYSGTLSVAYTLNLGPAGNKAATYSQFDIADGGTIYAGALTVNGTNVVNISDASLSVGTYTLINYGGITYGTTSGFRAGTLPAGVTASIQDTGSSIQLVVTSVSATAPVFSGIATLPDHNFQLTFSGANGQGYAVLATTNLALPLAEWTTISTGTFGSAPVTFDDLNATNYPQQFYIVTYP